MRVRLLYWFLAVGALFLLVHRPPSPAGRRPTTARGKPARFGDGVEEDKEMGQWAKDHGGQPHAYYHKRRSDGTFTRPRDVATPHFRPMIVPVPAIVEEYHNCVRPLPAIGKTLTLRGDREFIFAWNLAASLRPDLGIHFSQHGTAKALIHLELEKKFENSEDEYRLEVRENSIVATAMTRGGMLYAALTFLQLVEQSHKGQTVTCAVIHDFPRYEWRGLHLDVSRHFFPLADVKRIVDHLAAHKLNRLHLHLTDDQGWRVEVKSHPEMHQVGGRRGKALNGVRANKYKGKEYATPMYYTQDEVHELVQYADQRNVKVMPEFDLPAHAGAIVNALGSAGFDVGTYINSNEDCTPMTVEQRRVGAPNCMGGTQGILHPDAAKLAPLKEVLEEAIGLFPYPFVHMGGDEAEFVRAAAWRQKLPNATDAELKRLQGVLTTFLADIAIAKGKTPLFWDETFLELGNGFQPPPRSIATWWRDDRTTLEEVSARASSVILTPKTRVYFDYYQLHPPRLNKFQPMQAPYNQRWKAVTIRRTYDARYLMHPKVIGVQGCLWTELVPNLTVAEYQLFPRLYALSEVAWSPNRFQDPSEVTKTAAFVAFTERSQTYNAKYDANFKK